MTRIAVLALFAFTISTSLAYAEDDKWLCIADAATGFKYNNGSWPSANFFVKEDRYLVSKKPYGGDEKDLRYAVTRFGDKSPEAYCDKDSPNSLSWIFCDRIGFILFKININNLRYLKADLFGYAGGTDQNENSPHIEIGKCSKL
jgi:hypothetical protein